MSKSNGYKTAAHIQDRIMQKMMAENERLRAGACRFNCRTQKEENK